MSAKRVGTVLGTMTFGWAKSSSPVDDKIAAAMVDTFLSRGGVELDTALMYAAGETEKIIGRILKESAGREEGSLLATKANPWGGPSPDTGTTKGVGGLSSSFVAQQLDASLASLQQNKVDLFYLHAPDKATTIEETLAATQKLYEAGKFSKLGLSNYSAWETMYIWHLCDKNGWVKPTVYQGMYNAITRQVEHDLFPALRKLGMRFLAYNPLAAGLLTGKHSQDNIVAGRFDGNQMYKDRFWKDSYFAALDTIQEACKAEGVTMTDASLRWLVHHSQLSTDRDDGVIIGASNMTHLDTNLDSMFDGQPLPESIVVAFDAAWSATKRDCPAYERGWSAQV